MATLSAQQLSFRTQDRPVVLFVDQDQATRLAFQSLFARGFEVLTAGDCEEVWQLLGQHRPDVIIADQRMMATPDMHLLVQVRAGHPGIKRMLVASGNDIRTVIELINQCGVMCCITTPMDPVRVNDLVRTAQAELVAERERDSYTRDLAEANRQLEFALRQQLLS